MSEPQTLTGIGLAAFLRGLLPETRQFDAQIAAIESEAVSLFLERSAECSAELVEATAGFEPANRGFADLSTTSVDAHMAHMTNPDHGCSAEETAE